MNIFHICLSQEYFAGTLGDILQTDFKSSYLISVFKWQTLKELECRLWLWSNRTCWHFLSQTAWHCSSYCLSLSRSPLSQLSNLVRRLRFPQPPSSACNSTNPPWTPSSLLIPPHPCNTHVFFKCSTWNYMALNATWHCVLNDFNLIIAFRFISFIVPVSPDVLYWCWW